jgi:hypothetical protein
MIDWGHLRLATGGALRGMSDIAIVGNWLDNSDEGAFASIVTQVGTASADEVDRLDAALLWIATTNFNAEARRRLVKFYAIFKIAEMQRYREFRGFPP